MLTIQISTKRFINSHEFLKNFQTFIYTIEFFSWMLLVQGQSYVKLVASQMDSTMKFKYIWKHDFPNIFHTFFTKLIWLATYAVYSKPEDVTMYKWLVAVWYKSRPKQWRTVGVAETSYNFNSSKRCLCIDCLSQSWTNPMHLQWAYGS